MQEQKNSSFSFVVKIFSIIKRKEELNPKYLSRENSYQII